MKTTFVSLLLIGSFWSFGQVVDHFSSADARWFVKHTYPNTSPDFPSFIETRTTIYGVQGDSLHGGETWMKIYSSYDSAFSQDFTFEALLRSENNQVWMLDSNGQTQLLYDFNLTVGDSFLFPFEYTPEYIDVEEVDSIMINGQLHKRIKFGEPSGPTIFASLSEVWIEGVGSIRGPLFTANPRLFSSEMPDWLFLTCTYTDDALYWQDTTFDACFKNVLLSTTENKIFESVKIYPIPFENELTIQYNFHDAFLEIINMQGQVVHSESIRNQKNVLGLGHLPAGVYFIRMQKEQEVMLRRVLKN